MDMKAAGFTIEKKGTLRSSRPQQCMPQDRAKEMLKDIFLFTDISLNTIIKEVFKVENEKVTGV
jgi:hypothetical protein